jgi:hypothetical protein
VKRGKGQLFGSIACGLVFLFVIISITVLESSPEPQNPQQQQRLLEAHEAIMYFIDAEIMAKHLFPNPSTRWSHYILDAGSACGPIGNGVWYARGTVEVQTNLLPYRLPWEVCFLPDGRVPLYAQVGDTQSGDLNAALRMAGYSEHGRGGAPSEK